MNMTKSASERMEKYFSIIDDEVTRAYAICSEARKKGYDPEDDVSMPLAKNMAERVEGLIAVVEPKVKGSGISTRINELEEKFGKLSWKVALAIALETAEEKFCKFESKMKAIETGIRIGLAYLTLGVVASPLEGFVELKLKKRLDNGKEYFCLMYSGPIRSAGGTAAAVSVLVADYVRKKMGYDEYDPTDDEARRGVSELYDYHDRITNLQYLPSEEEIIFMAKHLPVQIDGDPSEELEVSNYKDIPRINTNLIRSGYCLVMGECLCQKAQKIWKQIDEWGNEFDMSQWKFLSDFVKLQKLKKAKKVEGKDSKLQPDYTYIKDLVAGRPILGFPLRNGGFRLRYGRCRNTGLSSGGINPALTYILDKYIAIGTQLKVERPGKATSISTCSSIEGPLVRLNDGSLVRINTVVEAKRISSSVEEIVYLGDILFNYGDFFNRAHPLVPPGYCEEWWAQEAKNAIENKYGSLDFLSFSASTGIEHERILEIFKETHNPSIKGDEALLMSKSLSVPLHPRYTYYWNSVPLNEIPTLFSWLLTGKEIYEGSKLQKIVIGISKPEKILLELLGVPHSVTANEYVVIGQNDSIIIAALLSGYRKSQPLFSSESLLSDISKLMGVGIRDRCGTFIGARMGRPEKAKVRKLDGQPHCLFPVGTEGGRLRSFQEAISSGSVTSDFPRYLCQACGNDTVLGVCEKCGQRTKKQFYSKQRGWFQEEQKDTVPYSSRGINIPELYTDVLKNLKLKMPPELVKGVKGTSNKSHAMEHLAKGILRAVHDIPVNKDGTTRYDMTQLAITHFKPREIGTSIERLKEMGYSKDIAGNDLADDSQIIELMPQDVILPACNESPDKGSDEILFRVSLFIDDLLKRLYLLKPYYGLKSKEDLVGHLIVALAPHTSAGIIGRIIGFSATQGFYAHPMLHAATRRDCDGDEACVTLLADALLNFSRQYLPNSRGATQDAPLVLTSKLIPSEVDDMVFDMDICSQYPVEFYNACLEYKFPWEIRIEKLKSRLNTEGQYEGSLFTHDTEDINMGVRCSAYKLLPTMEQKLFGQMQIAHKIRAVDEQEVAKIVIEKHFMRDIKGNLRKFSQQQFRCVSCNEKYRRPPLAGKCLKCKGRLLFTVSEGSIVKYLQPALDMAKKYNLPNYLKQNLEITQESIESIFGRDKERQEALKAWF